jgi:DNA-binding winged helix-turn-helix (wHTH) protein
MEEETAPRDDAMATELDATNNQLSFGPFNLLIGERLLTREGMPVELGARALDILLALISRPNEVVSKKDLMARGLARCHS